MRPVELSCMSAASALPPRPSTPDLVRLCRNKSHLDDARWATVERLVEEGFPEGELHEFGCHGAGTASYVSVRTGRHVFAWDRFHKGCSAPTEKDFGVVHTEGFMWTDVGKICDVEGAQVVPVVYDLTVRPYPICNPIAFAFIDVNLYEPTLAALREALGRLVRGGIILVDDTQYPGVAMALRECGWPYEASGNMAIIRKPALPALKGGT